MDALLDFVLTRKIVAVLELGCLFGALGAGVLADRVSRRSSITSACGMTLYYFPDFLRCDLQPVHTGQ